jgi:hypothetical protein
LNPEPTTVGGPSMIFKLLPLYLENKSKGAAGAVSDRCGRVRCGSGEWAAGDLVWAFCFAGGD